MEAIDELPPLDVVIPAPPYGSRKLGVKIKPVLYSIIMPKLIEIHDNRV